MSKLLTSSQRNTYERDGIVFPIRVLTPEEAAAFRTASDQMETQMGGKPRTVEVRQMHLHLPWAYELATHPRILDAVADLSARTCSSGQPNCSPSTARLGRVDRLASRQALHGLRGPDDGHSLGCPQSEQCGEWLYACGSRTWPA